MTITPPHALKHNTIDGGSPPTSPQYHPHPSINASPKPQPTPTSAAQSISLPPRIRRTSSGSSVTSTGSTSSLSNPVSVLSSRSGSSSSSSLLSTNSSRRQRSKSWTVADKSSSNAATTVQELEQNLKWYKKRLGPDHSTLAAIYNQIGNIHFRQGRFHPAEQAYKKAIACQPGEHLCAAYMNLGTLCWRTCHTVEAIHYLQQALSVHELDLAQANKKMEESTVAANVYHQLGLCFALSADYEQALDALSAAQQIREGVLGPMHAEVGRTLDAVGKVYFLQGDFEPAIACYQAALQRLTSNKVHTVQNLSQALAAAGRPDKAVLLMQDVLKHQKTAIALDCNEATSKALYETFQSMAVLYEQMNELERAARCRQEAAVISQEVGLPERVPL